MSYRSEFRVAIKRESCYIPRFLVYKWTHKQQFYFPGKYIRDRSSWACPSFSILNGAIGHATPLYSFLWERWRLSSYLIVRHESFTLKGILNSANSSMNRHKIKKNVNSPWGERWFMRIAKGHSSSSRMYSWWTLPFVFSPSTCRTRDRKRG